MFESVYPASDSVTEQRPKGLPNRSLRDPGSRMRFLALHLHDMQSLRWLPAHLAGILFLLVPLPISFDAKFYTIAGLLLLTPAWFFWFRAHVRTRFGESNIDEELRKASLRPWQNNRTTRWLLLLIVVLCLWSLVARFALNLQTSWILLMNVPQFISIYANASLDETNLVERRVVKGATAAAFVALLLLNEFATFFGLSLRSVAIASFVTVGLVLLLNAIYDYALLHRCARASRMEAAHG